MPADSRALSLSELRSLDSIADAEQFLASKEIDSLLRGSLEEQVGYFSKKGVDLSSLNNLRDELVEVSQRRNLLVHNSGIVNRYYLERVSPELADRFQAVKGKRIFVTPEYFKCATDVVHVAGLVLMQQCWRKWEKSEMASADSVLAEQVYEALADGNFELVVRLSHYTLGVPLSSDDTYRRFLINAAIAHDRLGDSVQVETLLRRTDWTACSLVFQVALAVLRCDDEKLYRLLPRAIAAGEIDESNLREWPLFSKHWLEARFKAEVERFFKEIEEAV